MVMQRTREGYELGLHAGQEASEAIVRIADTMPDEASKVLVAATAMAYIDAKLRLMCTGDPVFATIVKIASNQMYKKLCETPEAKELLGRSDDEVRN